MDNRPGNPLAQRMTDIFMFNNILKFKCIESGAVIGISRAMATTNSVTRNRLIEERKAWRKDRPFGFHAKPKVGDNGCVFNGIDQCAVESRSSSVQVSSF